MKKLLLILLVGYMSTSFSQTTLAPGDILFVGLNSDSYGSPAADEFDVLFLEPVDTGTVIYFTDFGYTGNAAPYFQQNLNNGCPANQGGASDGMIRWTATSPVAAGEQLVIRVNITGVSGPTCNIGTVDTVVETQTSGTSMTLTIAGETVHAFQGTINGSNQVTSLTMLTSINYNDVWDGSVTTCQFSSTISQNPGTGYEIVYGTEFDNGYYSGSLTGTKSELQAAILNMANWTRSDSTQYDFPIEETLGINELNDDAQNLVLYPNPTSNSASINLEVIKVVIYDTLGKIVLETASNKLETGALKTGIYLVKIETKNGTTMKKLIKR